MEIKTLFDFMKGVSFAFGRKALFVGGPLVGTRKTADNSQKRTDTRPAPTYISIPIAIPIPIVAARPR